MNSLVSIVIPTYNRERDLDRAISSVIAQTYQHWEILIVDNHSSDNTDELIRSFNDSRLKLFKINNNGVIAASRNLGIKNAKGKYIAFLDSDDWWTPQKLEVSLKYLEQGADVIYHDLFLASKSEQKIFWRKAKTRTLFSPIFNDLISYGNGLNTSSVMVRRKIIEQNNGMSEDTRLIASEDYDTWLRIAKTTEKFIKIPNTLGYYWADGKNYWSGSSPQKITESIEYIESLYADDFKTIDNSVVYWKDYAKGMAYYRYKNYSKTKQYLNPISNVTMPFFIKIKVKYALLIANMN